ncbi:uncharacterized protein K02A2.6-like [Latimeria chalumnae]|uniref:uncharacterized protein K02A2.6-like n=1 Tax=Latimeria chalumnae TaxID=7897 RepID=UPI00313AA62A
MAKEDKKESVHLVKKADASYGKLKSDKNKMHHRKVEQKETYKHTKGKSCGKCGNVHEYRNCPAFGKKCKFCGKYNHFARQCKSKANLHAVRESRTDSSENELNIDAIQQNSRTEKEWTIDIETNGSMIKYKVDTDAEINVLTAKLWGKFKKRPQLKKQPSVLKAYNGQEVPTIGKCTLKLKYKGKTTKHDFVVVTGENMPLLGLQTSQNLGLIDKLFEVKESQTKNLETLLMTYEDVFVGLGKLPVTYEIALKPEAQPVVHATKRVPVALRERLRKELQCLIELDVIECISEPTALVHSLVIVEKKDGSLRLCLDPKELNESIRREHHHIPTRNEILGEMAGAKMFTILDASNGFWQISLSKNSRKLCTFNTPFGRNCFKCLPFGLTSAPEIFHRTMQQMLDGVEGVKVYIDDILIWGATESEHDERLERVLQIARNNGLKLNKMKCQFKKTELLYLGEIISHAGVKPDPAKVQAIERMPSPTNKKELQKFMGMLNYLSKYIANLSDKTKKHERSVNKCFDINRQTKISTNASKEGIGTVLLQLDDIEWRPLAYASHAFTNTEYKYAQIEKETLGIAFGCEAFHNYVYGIHFKIETDHKPLLTITKKELWKAPSRSQRLLLKLQKYDYEIEFTPGRHLLIADALSRTWSESNRIPDSGKDTDVEVHINSIMSTKTVSETMWKKFKEETAADELLQEVISAIHSNNPKKNIPRMYSHYWSELTMWDGVLLKGTQIVIPTTLRKDMLYRIHEGHMGIQKCRRRAREAIFWPSMNEDITKVVAACQTCQKFHPALPKETLEQDTTVTTAWDTIGVDMFTLEGKEYLAIIDAYSNYPEVVKLKYSTSEEVCRKLKPIFCRYGIPTTVRTDNGPQFIGKDFVKFKEELGFKHITSSPMYSQSNRLAECGVKTVKRLLKKSYAFWRRPSDSIIEL